MKDHDFPEEHIVVRGRGKVATQQCKKCGAIRSWREGREMRATTWKEGKPAPECKP